MDETIIQDLSLFKLFYDDKNNTPENEVNQFTNNIEAMINQQTYPTISGEVYIANQNGEAVNESDLTDKYGVAFPNLKIRVAKVNPAYIAKYIQIIGQGKENELDIIRFAPTEYEGQSPTLTAKFPTETNKVFKGWALDKEGKKMVYVYDLLTRTIQEGPYISDSAFKFSSTNSVISLYAIFEPEQLGVKFYDADGSLLVEDPEHPVYHVTGLNQQEQVTKLVPYDTILPILQIMPYKDDSALALDRTYLLTGWSTTPDGKLVDIYKDTVKNNLEYYPHFTEGDAKKNVLSEEYFVTEQSSFAINASYYRRPEYNHFGEPGVLIGLKPGYSVRGKITLPKAINGVKVRGVMPAIGNNTTNGFCGISASNPNTSITAVFWEEGAVPEVYSVNCFKYCTNLTYVEFPPSLYNIDASAFLGSNLHNRDLNSAINLTEIGSSAFNNAFGVTDNKTFIIPGWVKKLSALCFAYNNTRNVDTSAITSWQIGDNDNPTILNSLPGNITTSTNPFAYSGVPYSSFII